MKIVIFIYGIINVSFFVFLTIAMLTCCNDYQQNNINYVERKFQGGNSITYYDHFVIDGHEYIISYSHNNCWIVGPHKINCKFCKGKE